MFHIYSFAIKYLCAKYTIFFYIGEKRLGGHPSSEETRDPPPLEEGEIPQRQEKQEEEDVVELVTTTGECLQPQAQVIVMLWIQGISPRKVGCNVVLENIKKNNNDVILKNNKNIIDVLGRV
ncbi:hypothetical protein AB205_0123680 [Aquarana catesbeiana]|uniref:Uncharacterized protein n=1 Tax=Aquarana catesbeiana TaxID=8400 RepID=A0A2G9S4D3_AQUCT|nr:hypothetical protein AB205_0123680 [Aquarana catesbeiana]